MKRSKGVGEIHRYPRVISLRTVSLLELITASCFTSRISAIGIGLMYVPSTQTMLTIKWCRVHRPTVTCVWLLPYGRMQLRHASKAGHHRHENVMINYFIQPSICTVPNAFLELLHMPGFRRQRIRLGIYPLHAA